MAPIDSDINSTSTSCEPTEFIPRPSSPLFLHSSDIPELSLVPVPFSGSDFGGWRSTIIVSLSGRNKIEFIDGTFPRPPHNSPECKQWDMCNNLVISWLASSLSPSIAESVQYSETTEDIWTQLNKRYGTGALDIASYFNKLKKLWDELRVMRSSHSSTCTCAPKAGIQKEEEEDRLHQFLMGLNYTYVNVRSNLLMMQQPPSLDNAYNILLQDERKRHVNPSTQFGHESASFNVASLNFSQPSHPQKQYPQRVSFDSNRAAQFCKYCKKSGHLIDKCYKLHGFFTSFKFTKGRKMVANAEVELASNSA
ncbi:uncharacterized protein LOC142169175 [Nicotiana tabacum]|uniref:Uncharacterized protein LOC142169175 n=1 Tax=Nicotiana tabacum TaxID=4097 RepID=A0AC58SNG6_TOBAC